MPPKPKGAPYEPVLLGCAGRSEPGPIPGHRRLGPLCPNHEGSLTMGAVGMVQPTQTKKCSRHFALVADVPGLPAHPQRPNASRRERDTLGSFFLFVRGFNRSSTTAHNKNTMTARASRPTRDAVRIIGCRADGGTLLPRTNSVGSLGPVPTHPMRYGHCVAPRTNVALALPGIDLPLKIKSRGRKNGACVSNSNLERILNHAPE